MSIVQSIWNVQKTPRIVSTGVGWNQWEMFVLSWKTSYPLLAVHIAPWDDWSDANQIWQWWWKHRAKGRATLHSKYLYFILVVNGLWNQSHVGKWFVYKIDDSGTLYHTAMLNMPELHHPTHLEIHNSRNTAVCMQYFKEDNNMERCR